MNKTGNIKKAGVLAVSIVFLFMATAPILNAQMQQRMPLLKTNLIAYKQIAYADDDDDPMPLTYTSSINSLCPGATTIMSPTTNTSNGDEPFPPPLQRCSFLFIKGIYQDVDGVRRLIGIDFVSFVNPRGGYHEASWYPSEVCMVMEGDHAGTYYFPLFFWFVNFSGDGFGWSGFHFQDTWDPNHDRIAYFHIWADYKEDGQHIRFADRTLTEDWSNNNE